MLVVQLNGDAKAYAEKDLRQLAGKSGFLDDEIGGEQIRVFYTAKSKSLRAESISTGQQVPSAYMFCFAMNAMWPEISVYSR